MRPRRATPPPEALGHRAAVVRWVAFTPPAVEAGARAVFGFPLRVGAVRLDALNLYNDRPGALTAETSTPTP